MHAASLRCRLAARAGEAPPHVAQASIMSAAAGTYRWRCNCLCCYRNRCCCHNSSHQKILRGAYLVHFGQQRAAGGADDCGRVSAAQNEATAAAAAAVGHGRRRWADGRGHEWRAPHDTCLRLPAYLQGTCLRRSDSWTTCRRALSRVDGEPASGKVPAGTIRKRAFSRVDQVKKPEPKASPGCVLDRETVCHRCRHPDAVARRSGRSGCERCRPTSLRCRPCRCNDIQCGNPEQNQQQNGQ